MSIAGELAWVDASDACELLPGEAHLWRASIPHLLRQGQLADFRRQLSDPETEYASQFRFQRDREAYVLSHGLTRSILSRYLRFAARHLQVVRATSGKLWLTSAPDSPLHFNLSHSHSLFLLAVTRERRIGVDLEPTKTIWDWPRIASANFSAPERAALAEVPEREQPQEFLKLWTRKEAYLKAQRQGLARPLSSFSILPAADGLLALDDSSEPHPHAWSFHDFQPDDSHVGALALIGSSLRLRCFNWTAYAAKLN